MKSSNNNKESLNRIPYTNPPFDIRGQAVKWPTIRDAYLTDVNVPILEQHVKRFGKSIIFLDGTYETNLNKHATRSPVERAVFFEWFIRAPNRWRGGIFFLCWIGNFHNGCIFHCAPQYPQSAAWQNELGYDWLNTRAMRIYAAVVNILYPSGILWDLDVTAFIEHSRSSGRQKETRV